MKEIKLALNTIDNPELLAQDLIPTINQIAWQECKLFALLPFQKAKSKTHEFNSITSIPSGDFMGEKAKPESSNVGTQRSSVQLKILKVDGGVTDFGLSTMNEYINALELELNAKLLGMIWRTEYGLLWGNAVADQYQFSGFDALVNTYRFNVNNTVSLDLLSQDMKANVEDSGGKNLPKLWLMSSKMHNKIKSLHTQIYKTLGAKDMEFAGGFSMPTYDDIPIYTSTFCTADSVSPASINIVDSNEAGNLEPEATYYYRVAAVTFSEKAACESTGHTVGEGKSAVTISWTPNPDARLYKIYRTEAGGDPGTEKLEAIIPAKTYDANGNITGNVSSYVSKVADANLGTDAPLDLNDETIFLITRDMKQALEVAWIPNLAIEAKEAVFKNGIIAKPEDMPPIYYVRMLGADRDATSFIITAYLALALKNEKLCAVARKVRI